MARLFNYIPEEVEVEAPTMPTKKKKKFLLIGIMVFIVITTILMFVIEEKKEKDKNKISMNKLAELVVMDNGCILTQKVKYATTKKVDPDDTSDIFYEVVNGDEKYTKGALVKFNHRFIQPQQIEGENYCVIETSQIQFHIKKEDVKDDLLKR